MKKCILCFFIASSISLSSQTTLTRAFNEPQVGDVENTYDLDTSFYAAGLPLNVIGNGVVWNFTNLKASQPVIASNYLSAASVTSSSSYPGCTFVQEASGVTSYFKSATTPTTQTEVLGIKASTLSINFSNSGIVAKYPVVYGSTTTDNLAGSFSYSSIPGTCSGNITTNADGFGTLNLPEGIVISNVLRVKSVQTITLSTFIGQALIKQTIYNYYSPSQKFPVLTINYSYFSSPLSPTPSQTGFAAGSTNYFVTGLNENSLQSSDVNLYPNPALNSITLELKGSLNLLEIKVYNQLGEIILNGAEPTLEISNLQTGVYLLEIITDIGTSRKKFIKE